MPRNADARKLLGELAGAARDGDLRFWERRFYDFNVWSDGKVWEKLEYMHTNPVKRELVARPDEWPWSSYRAYALSDSSLLRVDCCPPDVPQDE
ncbi:MAG: hypothetical protein KGL59_10995 [Acidobacteriota bacterium]|nr:hypothetical protein [Acidobacteriota bacterium]